MDFKIWIHHFKDVDRPIGDLAKDIAGDKEFPSKNDRKLIRDYLEKKADYRAQEAVLETFDNAWSYYMKDRP